MEFLSVGTLVRLSKGENKVDVVIIGRMIQNADKQISDYIGVIYPYGYLGDEQVLRFNQEDILEVIMEGYYDEREEEINEMLIKEKNKIKKNIK